MKTASRIVAGITTLWPMALVLTLAAFLCVFVLPAPFSQYGGDFLNTLWPFLAFVLIFPPTVGLWLFWRRARYKESINFILLELRIPREIKKSPRGMEQVLTSLNALRNSPGDLSEYWWEGEIVRWFSLEMVSFGGEVHFYIRTYDKQKPLVEAAFFAYYPDVEIVEVDDYIDRFPATAKDLARQGYDMWGGEMFLKKSGAFPIRSYIDFESPDEDKQYDPISAFLEVLGKAKQEEIVAIQILASAVNHDWRDQYEDVIVELLDSKNEKVNKKASGGAKTVTAFPGGVLPAFSVEKIEDVKDSGTEALRRAFNRTPGKTDVIKAVENNLSKPAFETLIRFLYFSPHLPLYDSYARRGLLSAFNQYGELDLNYFAVNYPASTRTKVWQKPYIFPVTRNLHRKERVLYNYKKRAFPELRIQEKYISERVERLAQLMGQLMGAYLFNWNFASKISLMNTESLATLFHPPTIAVLTAPHMKRVESKKAAPPAGLAIFGDEKSLEDYQ